MGFTENCDLFSGEPSSVSTASGAPPDWEKTVTALPRGDFPNPRPLVATYNFGWSELVAATAEIRFDKSGERLQLAGYWTNCRGRSRALEI